MILNFFCLCATVFKMPTWMMLMLLLTKPATQHRLNAAVVEVLGLNVMGPVRS
jgi:cell shape-determining protein MreD